MTDDLGYAIVLNVDYVHNEHQQAKDFFNLLYSALVMNGFSFDDRFFYKLGTKSLVEQNLKSAVQHVQLNTSLIPKNFLRSVHLIPLSQFQDITKQLVTAAAV